jgi:PAS domain-containing protein
VKHPAQVGPGTIGSRRMLTRPAMTPELAETRYASEYERAAREKVNFARAPVPMLVLDAKGLVADVSDRCLDLLGYDRKEVLGHHLSDGLERFPGQG